MLSLDFANIRQNAHLLSHERYSRAVQRAHNEFGAPKQKEQAITLGLS
jgi:hypothetical protein